MIPTGWSAPHFTSHPPASLFPLTLPLSFCSWFGLPHEVAPPPSLSPTSAFLPPLSRSSSHSTFSHLPSHLLSHIILTHPTHSPPTLSRHHSQHSSPPLSSLSPSMSLPPPSLVLPTSPSFHLPPLTLLPPTSPLHLCSHLLLSHFPIFQWTICQFELLSTLQIQLGSWQDKCIRTV